MSDELLIGFGGAVVGGLFTFGAAYQSHRHNLDLERVQSQKRIDGFLQAIRCELAVMQKSFDEDVGGMLMAVKDGDPFDAHFSMTEKYFIVYPNNTEIVGQIDDGELVNAIVTTYTKANLLVEGFHMNNWYSEEAKRIAKELHTAEGDVFVIASTPSMTGLGTNRKEHLEKKIIPTLGYESKQNHEFWVKHAVLLKKENTELRQEIKDLFARIDSYRQRHPVNR